MALTNAEFVRLPAPRAAPRTAIDRPFACRKPRKLNLQYSHRGHEAWEQLAAEFGSALLRLEAFQRS